MARAKLIFISGGVRSGKSAYAESLVRQFDAQRKIYLASGLPNDAEMKKRIERHRSDRKMDGWQTVEQAKQFEHVLPLLETGDAVLWDCATTWLANELYEGWDRGKTCAEQHGCMEMKWENMQKTLLEILNKTECLVIVSNEILDDFRRDEQYMKWLGKIHIWLVQEADQAIEMESGIAFKRK